jgi:hypothetical protein
MGISLMGHGTPISPDGIVIGGYDGVSISTGSNSYNPRFFVNQSGNVGIGIGTTTPSYKLDVSGTGRFTQPVVVGTPTDDTHATTKNYVDSVVSGGSSDASYNTLSVSGYKIEVIDDSNTWTGSDPGLFTPIGKFKSQHNIFIDAYSAGCGTGGEITYYIPGAYIGTETVNSRIKVYSLGDSDEYPEAEDEFSVYLEKIDTSNYYLGMYHEGGCADSNKSLTYVIRGQEFDTSNTDTVQGNYTVAAERKYIYSGDNGYVGIGTDTPGRTLDVTGGTSDNFIRFNRGSSYFWDIGQDSSSDFTFDSQTGGEIMRLNYDGNVGIGTSTPSTALEVVGTITADTFDGTFTGSYSGTLSAGNISAGSFGSNTGGGNYTFPNDLTVDTNTLFVDASTNRVGIATTTPGFTLEVDGEVRVGASGESNLLEIRNPGVGNSSMINFKKSSDTARIIVEEYSNDATEFQFYMSDNPSSTSDKFNWFINSWEGDGGDWMPLEFKGYDTKIQAEETTFYGGMNLYSVPYYTSAGEISNVSESKSGSLSINVDVSGATNTSFRLYTIEIDGTSSPNTFRYCHGHQNYCTWIDSAIAITGGWQTLDNGVQIDFSGTTGGAVGDRYSFGVWPGKNVNIANGGLVVEPGGQVGIGDTTPSYDLDVAGDINLTGTLYQNGSPFQTGYWEQSGSNIYYNSGNVGIGTSTPGEKLHVSAGNINLDAGYKYNFRDRNDEFIGDENYALVLNTPEGVKINLDANNNGGSFTSFRISRDNSNDDIAGGTTIFEVQEGGNVGIGVASPNYKLDVAGTSNFEDTMYFNANGGPSGLISFGASNFVIKAQNNLGLTLTDDSDNGIQILDGGNVGIGANNPLRDLVLYDSSSLVTFQIANSATGVTASDGAIIQMSSDDLLIGNQETAGGNLKLFVDNDASKGITIQENTGNVGIGISTPSTALEVVGTITADTFDGTFTGSYSGTLSAANVSAGSFGSNTGGGNYIFPSDLTVGTSNYGMTLKSGDYPYKGYWYYSDDGSGYGPAWIHNNTTSGNTYPTMFLQTASDGASLKIDNAIYLGDMSGAIGDMPSMTTRTRIVGGSGGDSYFNTGGGVAIGTTNPGTYELYVNGDSYFANGITMNSGTLDLGANDISMTGNIGNINKLTATTIDPIFEIEGNQYATYVSDHLGVATEETGVFTLERGDNGLWIKVINFNKEEKGTDLWLFSKTVDWGDDMEDLIVLLTKSFRGDIWYETNSENETLIIYAKPLEEKESLRVSYSLTAPRIDHDKWGNIPEEEIKTPLKVEEYRK